MNVTSEARAASDASTRSTAEDPGDDADGGDDEELYFFDFAQCFGIPKPLVPMGDAPRADADVFTTMDADRTDRYQIMHAVAATLHNFCHGVPLRKCAND